MSKEEKTIFQTKVFNDPIHGHLELHPLLIKIIDTPQFQRLRFIKQLGGAYFVYPGASHNRFEHSIGVAHLAGELARALRTRQPKLDITDEDILCVQIAGLCHDLGHGPFSHLYDGMFIKKQRELEKKKKEQGQGGESGPEASSSRNGGSSLQVTDSRDAEGDTEGETGGGRGGEAGGDGGEEAGGGEAGGDEGEEAGGGEDGGDGGGEAGDSQHEKASIDMFDYLVEVNDLKKEMKEEDLVFIKELIDPKKEMTPWPYKGRTEEKSFLYEIVSNKRNGVDVDKFDYFARDFYHLGMKNNFDYRRFLKFARVCEVGGEKQICVRDKEAVNIYDMFHTRYYLHKRACQHKVHTNIEAMITNAFVKADGHITVEGSGGRMFTLSTAMKDMEAYTKLTDRVFEEILFSSSDELKEAREILKRIISRDLYRFLDEIPTETQTETLAVKQAWEAGLAELNEGLQSEDFEVLVITLDYGKKDKNPVDHMHFYSKENPDVAVKFPKEKVSQLLLTKFSETITRFYYKKTDGKSLEAAKKLLKQLKRKERDDGKVFNDPIHGHLELHPLLIKIIDTPQFQRLRFIKQLGGAYFVYPGASHNRFEHSIGVAHLAGELAQALTTRQPELGITDEDILCVQIAGLCHDLGHGPFSHLYDGMFIKKQRPDKKWEHEEASIKMFDHLVKDKGLEKEMKKWGLNPANDVGFIKEMIYGPLDTEVAQDEGDIEMMDPENQESSWPYKGRGKEKSFLYEIVSNKRNGIDVDKFDYFARDCHHLGMKNNFDYRRFLHFARVCEVDGEKQICVRDKEASNIYDMFHTRYYLHKRAYQHKVNKNIETMITDAFVKADGHITVEGSGGRMFTLSTAMDDMEAYTKLTDRVFEQILFSSSNELEEAKKILKRIISRDLYRFLGEKSIEEPEAVKQAWEAGLAELNEGLQSEDFEVLVITLDYGNQDKDLVDHMHFYSKENPDVAVKFPKEKVSQPLQKKNSEKIIRFYYKKTDETSLEAAKKLFKQWDENYQEDRDDGTPVTSHRETTN